MSAVEEYATESLRDKDTAALAHDWERAKAAEETCKEWRVAVEEALVTKLGHKPEGSKTHKVGYYSITLTGIINRKLDKEKWEEIKAKVPEELRGVVRMKPEVDSAGVKWLQENRPDVWKVVAQAVTVTPGKTGVKIVRKEE